MKSFPSLTVILVLIMAAMALIAPPSAAAAPLSQTNLIQNGGMETFGSAGVANGWIPWWEEVPNPGTGSLDYVLKPEWAAEYNSAFVHGGSASQHIGRRWDPWHAGIRQTITVAAGSKVRFTAYGRVFASTPDYPNPSDANVQSRMRIGADPNGGIDWASGSVVWSAMANPHNSWAPFTLEVTAGAAGKITLFLEINYRNDSRYHLDAWWDDVSAVVISEGAAVTSSAPTSPPPTQPPVQLPPFVMPTPDASGTVIYIVQPGDSLWRIAANAGLTLDELKAMNGLTSNIISPGQRLILKTGAAPAEPTASLPAEETTAVATAAENATSLAPAEATPTATAIVGVGAVCAMMYIDANGNARRESSEGLLAGGQLSVMDTNNMPLQTHITDGLSEPYCFTNLPVGNYTITAAPPEGYNSTSSPVYPLSVEADSLTNIEFGAQPGGATSPTTVTGGSGGLLANRRLRTALFGATGVVFLLLAAGIAAFLLLRRR